MLPVVAFDVNRGGSCLHNYDLRGSRKNFSPESLSPVQSPGVWTATIMSQTGPAAPRHTALLSKAIATEGANFLCALIYLSHVSWGWGQCGNMGSQKGTGMSAEDGVKGRRVLDNGVCVNDRPVIIMMRRNVVEWERLPSRKKLESLSSSLSFFTSQ